MKPGPNYALDPVGARAWQLLIEDNSLAEICGVMVEEYDVEREHLERDILKLAGELGAQGLVRRLPSECLTTD